MSRTKKNGPLDPNEDGPEIFDGYENRLALAVACGERVVQEEALGEAGHQTQANATKSAELLVEWAILEKIPTRRQQVGFRLAREWSGAVDQARLRAVRGRLGEGGTLLLIARPGIGALYELLADGDPVIDRLAWVVRLPHHPSFAALALLDPALDEGAIERLTLKLEQAGVEHQRLSLGELAGSAELRTFAASSLPGAFGPGA
jgi:hypothetical protein